jgi:hypothetical protein
MSFGRTKGSTFFHSTIRAPAIPGSKSLAVGRRLSYAPRMTSNKPKVQGRRIAAKAKKATAKVKTQRVAKTGLTSRVRGHVSARGRRAQGRRDSH